MCQFENCASEFINIRSLKNHLRKKHKFFFRENELSIQEANNTDHNENVDAFELAEEQVLDELIDEPIDLKRRLGLMLLDLIQMNVKVPEQSKFRARRGILRTLGLIKWTLKSLRVTRYF